MLSYQSFRLALLFAESDRILLHLWVLFGGLEFSMSFIA